MSVRRRAAKRDANEPAIIKALRAVGATVAQVSEKGFPDLVVGYRGATHLIEVKMPGKGLTPDQEKWIQEWRGSKVHVVETPLRALAAIGAAVISGPWPGERATVENGLLPAPRKGVSDRRAKVDP